jgi:polo-like kinase 1
VLHVDRWFRRKHATFFRLSNRIVQVRLLLFFLPLNHLHLQFIISFFFLVLLSEQVNFTDESKVILSSDGKMVTYVDKQGEVHVQTLEAIVLNPNPSIINRLKYTRDILGDLLRTKESRSSSSNDF